MLLKNENNTLPLNLSQKIALIGPLADDEFHILGNWAAHGNRDGVAVSIKEGFEAKGSDFKYAKGCEIIEGDTSNFEKAVSTAKASDIVVMVMGESERMSGEAASRSSIKLPGLQQKLIAEIKILGKPIVLVLLNGRPLDLSWESETVDAIVEAWFPGSSGGHAIADVLFGDYNPSGKLPVTFPRNIGQIPIFYNHKNTGRPINIEGPDPRDPRYVSKYFDVENSPLFHFGYGLSYTSFEYKDVAIDSNTLLLNSRITVTASITNTGDFDGEEIAQLYIKDKFGSITRPVKELKGFEKIFLKKGETKTVEFVITANDLKFYDNNLNFVNEAGDYELFVAGSSDYEFTHQFFLQKD